MLYFSQRVVLVEFLRLEKEFLLIFIKDKLGVNKEGGVSPLYLDPSGAHPKKLVKILEDSPNKKCIDKIMLVEETEYDEVITCDHSYDQR